MTHLTSIRVSTDAQDTANRPGHILILFEKTGGGHLRLAEIIAEMLGSADTRISVVAGSDMLGDKTIDHIVNAWNRLIRSGLLRTADFTLNFFLRLFILPFLEVSARSQRFYDSLDAQAPDMIICTADGYGRSLGLYCGARNIPLVMAVSEISIFADLVCPRAIHLFCFQETADLIRSYDLGTGYFASTTDGNAPWRKRLGYLGRFFREFVLGYAGNPIYRDAGRQYPEKNHLPVHAIGPLAPRICHQAIDRDTFRRAHGMEPGVKTVLVASGSLGGKFVVDTVRALSKGFQGALNVVAMCGRCERTYRKVSALAGKSTPTRVYPFGYRDDFEAFIKAADCIVARPSAGTFMDSLIAKTPFLSLGRATSNDSGTLHIIRKYHIGKVCRRGRELVPELADLLNNLEKYRGNITAYLDRYPDSFEAQARALRDLVAGTGEIGRGTVLENGASRKH